MPEPNEFIALRVLCTGRCGNGLVFDGTMADRRIEALAVYYCQSKLDRKWTGFA